MNEDLLLQHIQHLRELTEEKLSALENKIDGLKQFNLGTIEYRVKKLEELEDRKTSFNRKLVAGIIIAVSSSLVPEVIRII